MNNLTTLPPQISLPAEMLAELNALNGADDLSSGVSAGFAAISIRGAKWRIVVGGEEHPMYIPGTNDLAPSIKVVLLRANPAVSKVYYEGQFVEGSDAKPTCYSNDGIRPAADAADPQSDLCATCVKNAWGSKISPSGSKIKACSDVRRVAILSENDIDNPAPSLALLRVPAASLADLAAYGRALGKRNIPYAAVVTKLSFDPDAAYPKIVFSFDRVLTQEEMSVVAERMGEPVVEDILGLTPARGAAALPAPHADDKFGIPADVAAPTATPAPEPEPEAAPPKKTPATRTKKAAPEPEAAPAVEPVPVAEAGNIAASIDEALAAMDL